MTLPSFVFEKDVTISRQITKSVGQISTCKYKDLECELNNLNEIIADYPFGQMKLRIKLLEKLGFSLKETIWMNTERPHSRVKQIWIRVLPVANCSSTLSKVVCL